MIRIKIVITVEDFDPNKGYLEYYLARELTKLGHKISVFTFGKINKISKVRMKESFEVIRLPYLALLNGQHIPTPVGIAYAIQFIRKEKPEIIHCQPLSSILSIVFISFRQLFGYKIVGSVFSQNPLLDNTFKKLLFHLQKSMIKLYIKSRSEIIFVKSGNLMKAHEQLFSISRHKFHIIPLGADPNLFKYSDEARSRIRSLLGLSADNIVLVYSGRIIPSKRLDVLAKAIAPLIKQNEKIYLLIVGDSDSLHIKYIKQLIKNMGISKNVIFHPPVHRTRLPNLYSASDIAVWPGLSSISIVEAASVGLPIIMARSPVEIYAAEYENGFVFEPGNVNELREYLRILIYDEKTRKEMGYRSRLLVERRLNWRSIAIQYLDAYERTLQL